MEVKKLNLEDNDWIISWSLLPLALSSIIQNFLFPISSLFQLSTSKCFVSEKNSLDFFFFCLINIALSHKHKFFLISRLFSTIHNSTSLEKRNRNALVLKERRKNLFSHCTERKVFHNLSCTFLYYEALQRGRLGKDFVRVDKNSGKRGKWQNAVNLS